MNYTDFLNKLNRVRKTADGHTALCPAHDDRNPSLSVGYDERTGKILVKCFAGCTTDQIIGSMGLSMADLQNGDGKSRRKSSQLGPIVATYDYTNESGELVFQVTRHEPKTFRQRRPDGNGGWAWGLGGVKRILYNLPAIVALDSSEWVFIVEGEKDADRLNAQGLCATTNSGGADKWHLTDQKPLTGRLVAILPDNDPPGEKHIMSVAKSLHGIAEEVRIVRLSDLPPKGDVSDWLDGGHTTEELLQLVSEASAHEPKQSDNSNLLETDPENTEPQKGKTRRKDPTTAEYIEALTDLSYTFRWNELDDTIEVNDERINDGVAAIIRTEMRDRGYSKVQSVEDAYTAHAYRNRYHPVKEYLNGLKWDGTNYFAELGKYIADAHPAIVYEGGKSAPVFSVWFGRWMIGAVAKVFESGTVRGQNPMLVLDGGQNLGKSTFVAWLGSPLHDLFIESPIQPEDKEHNRYLASKWIWEVAELGATTRKADVEALKAFITKADSTFRKPYARHPVVKPALSSFVGTINNAGGFLIDETGNRRFLTITLQKIDWAYQDAIDVNQLWAQAMHLYRAGHSWHLQPNEVQTRDELNKAYEVEDPYEGWILKYFDVDPSREDWMTTSAEIAGKIQSMGVSGTTRAVQMSIGPTLRRLGLRQDTNARPRVWVGIQGKPE